MELYFAEDSKQAADRRVFSTGIGIDNQPTAEAFDIFESAGGGRTPTVIGRAVDVADSFLSIALDATVDPAMINGIGIFGIGGASIRGAPAALISAGAIETYVDVDGRTWSRDEFCNSGTTRRRNRRTISGTDDQEIFKSGRTGENQQPLAYHIPLPNPGNYEVELFFSETANRPSPGMRLFAIFLEGAMVVS